MECDGANLTYCVTLTETERKVSASASRVRLATGTSARRYRSATRAKGAV